MKDDLEGNIVSCKLRDDEIADYLDTLGHRLNGDQYEKARPQVESGNDVILKMLLLVHCPRIERLKFITQMHDEESCLHWLQTLISICISGTTESLPNIVWPLGLASVRDVAIGVVSDTWMDNRSQDPSSHIFVHLLRLPNITSLYYKDYQQEDEDEYEYVKDIPPGCSSVKHLFLDNCNSESMICNFKEALYKAPCSLETVSFCAGEAKLEYSDQFFSGFTEEQRSSLESFMFYDFGRRGYDSFHGYRCYAYDPDAIAGSSLKQVSISIKDIELFAYYMERDNEEGEDAAEAYVRHVADCLGGYECLILWDETGSGHAGNKPNETKLIERAVVKVIEGDVEDGNYTELKAIYLEEIEHRAPIWGRVSPGPYGPIPRDPRTKLCFQDAIAAGKKNGVDVHTLTNKNQMLHEISFPEAPDKYALETGPNWGRRPADWVFNPYLGRRMPPGCGKCGCCENCKAEYSEELWKTIKED